jgi:hypothetical protein
MRLGLPNNVHHSAHPRCAHFMVMVLLQIVHRYHRLIETFRDLTGAPMVLNSSFIGMSRLFAVPPTAS